MASFTHHKQRIATGVKSEDWRKIILGLRNEGWTTGVRENLPDTGIDSDFLTLRKGGEEILFGWDNWHEGEIKCSVKLMNELAAKFEIDFAFGKPVNLKRSVIWFSKLVSWFGGSRRDA